MKSIDMKNYAEGQVTFWTKQITFDKGQIEWTNKQLARTRKEDREQKEWAKTYNNGEYAHLYEGRYQSKETKKLLNDRRRWQRDLKNAEKELARYQQMVADNTEDEEIKEEETMTTTNMNEVVAKLSEMGITDETPSHLVVRGLTSKTTYYNSDCEEIAVVEQVGTFQPDGETTWTITDCRKTSAGEADENKEEDTMEQEVIFANPKTFTTKNGRNTVTFVKMWRRYPTDNWTLYDEDHSTWYRYSQWDEEGTMAYYIPDSSKGWELQLTQDQIDSVINDTINNKKEDTTMNTTNTSNPVTINLTEGVAKFELNGTTYKYNIESKRYAKTTPDGKTVRIGKAEYEAAKVEYDQQVLDDQPSKVEVENDLDKPAVLNENGLVDCSKCNCDKCVHRNCMRRNPRKVGGLGECPRLDNGIMGEAQKMAEETGMELAEAELAVNVQNEQKKPRKARKSKDIAYEGHGKTLTAKQVDFLLDLKQTDQWDGFDTMFWTDVICDEIEGQFAGKPMTVGAMISTLCEKGLAERSKGDFTDPVTNRTRRSTYMAFTGLGQEIAEELGL